MNVTGADGTGIEFLESLAAIGYDYIELSLSHIAALPAAEFGMLRHRLLQSGISCKSCNNFFPPSFRLTGPTADLEAIERYAELALGRAGQLGVEHVVFGSGPANRIPEGFAYDAAWTQLVELLHRFQPIAAKHGIRIAIEPLRRAECNIINSVAEGLKLVKACSLANIKLLADVFHMAEAGEELDVLLSARGYIEHIHIANPSGRLFPKPQDAYDYGRLFRYLREIGYQGKISVEAYTSNFYPDAADSLALLRNL